MLIQEKTRRLLMALRDGMNVHHGDFSDDLIEVLEYVDTATDTVNEMRDELRGERSEINSVKMLIDDEIDEIIDSLGYLSDHSDGNADTIQCVIDALESAGKIKAEVADHVEVTKFDPVNYDD